MTILEKLKLWCQNCRKYQQFLYAYTDKDGKQVYLCLCCGTHRERNGS